MSRNLQDGFLCIENILIKCGCSAFWNTQNVENPTWLVKSVNQKLKDLFINEWYLKVENKSSFHTYKLFKHKFQLKNYLLKLSYVMKKNLCLFRTRDHILPIECGRLRNEDISEKKGHLGHSGVGDEFSLLLPIDSVRAKEIHRQILLSQTECFKIRRINECKKYTTTEKFM